MRTSSLPAWRPASHGGVKNAMRRVGRHLLPLGLFSGLTTGSAFASGEPVRVLLLSGQNNHEWTATTPELEAILGEGGRFAVDVTEEPEALTARSLEPYDVIVSNWNAFGTDPGSAAWSPETREAYLDFVRQGKGHVVVHAGSSSFDDWGDYRRLTLATWKMEQTSHGPNHEFPVRIDDASHPVTAGLEGFTTTDELWNRPAVEEGVQVLASSFSATEAGGDGELGAHGPGGPVRPGAQPHHPPWPRCPGNGHGRIPGPAPARRRVGRHRRRRRPVVAVAQGR